jgi:hypothetical protein
VTTQLDSSIGAKKETTFGTGVTVDHFFEFNTEDFGWDPTFEQSKGQRYGRRTDASDRRVLTKSAVAGSLETDLLAKGMGALMEAALGSASSTVASAPAYQQLFTQAVNDFPPSYTIQKGIPLLGGAMSAHTFTGMVCSGFDLTLGNAGIPTLKFSFVGKDYSTATAYQVPSYIAGNSELSFVNAALTIGGTLTVPTTTALATVTGGTATDIRDFNFTYDNGLDGNGFNIGGGGKRTRPPAYGLRTGKGTLTAEFDAVTLRDAYLNQSDLALVFTFQDLSRQIVSTYYPTFQLVLPNIRLEGEIPKANGGDVITQSIGYTMFDNRVSQPIYVAIVTPETAI